MWSHSGQYYVASWHNCCIVFAGILWTYCCCATIKMGCRHSITPGVWICVTGQRVTHLSMYMTSSNCGGYDDNHSGAHFSFVNTNDLLKRSTHVAGAGGSPYKTISCCRQQYIITILLETTNMMQLLMCAYCCCTTFRPGCWHSIEWMLVIPTAELTSHLSTQMRYSSLAGHCDGKWQVTSSYCCHGSV